MSRKNMFNFLWIKFLLTIRRLRSNCVIIFNGWGISNNVFCINSEEIFLPFTKVFNTECCCIWLHSGMESPWWFPAFPFINNIIVYGCIGFIRTSLPRKRYLVSEDIGYFQRPSRWTRKLWNLKKWTSEINCAY